MSKGNKTRGNREVKKPKKTKEKALETVDFPKGKAPVKIGEKRK